LVVNKAKKNKHYRHGIISSENVTKLRSGSSQEIFRFINLKTKDYKLKKVKMESVVLSTNGRISKYT
jgi:hypothetical protein